MGALIYACGKSAQYRAMLWRDFTPPVFLSLLVFSCGDDARESDAGTGTTTTTTTSTTTEASTSAATTEGGLTESGSGSGGATEAAATSGTTAPDPTTGPASTGSSSGSTGAPACELKVFPNVSTKKPVDIFLYVDASGSLAPVLAQVNANIKVLPEILQGAEVDYRVLVVSRWPNACLSPFDCAAVKAPLTISDDGRLLYVDLGTGSSGVPDGYPTFIDQYWRVPYAQGAVEPFLRPDSVRVVFGFTDGEKASNDVAGAPATLALLDERLGAGQHTIHTVGGFTPMGILGPDAPLQAGACLGKDDSGPTQKAQQLSILTGGLRTSVCMLDALAIFKAIAESATATSTQCELPIPDTVETDIIDPNNVSVDLIPTMGDPQPLTYVPDAMSCVDLGFSILGNVIHLCPATCAAIKQDLGASLEIRHCVAPG